MSAVTHISVLPDSELSADTPQLTQASLNACSAASNVSTAPDTILWQFGAESSAHKESVLPREFRQRLYKHFARIEQEFEREYRRLYGENLALQERLEKFEDGDHSESTTLAKKLGASMLSQRIKQQYKQSTSRLVSSLRQSAGHSSSGLLTPTVGPLSSGLTSSPGNVSTVGLPIFGAGTAQGSVTMAGQLAGHGGTWQLMNRVCGHRDGLWEVTPYRRLLATASADSTVRLWSNDTQVNCLMIYLGHYGSVNSVRFRHRDHLMLTSSGDGTAHLVRLPFDSLIKVAHAMSPGQPAGSAAAALEAATSALAAEVAGSTNMAIAAGSAGLDSDEGPSVPHDPPEEGSPVRTTSTAVAPIHVRHPHAMFQSANLGAGGAALMGSAVSSTMESSPLSAADFLTGRDQVVTAGWDRLGRIYDLATGQEMDSLTGHDHQLTDVRCALGGTPLAVTSSRDCTFRLWDFRQAGMRVHVQQAHTQTVSTAQFLPGCPTERLISAGGDRLCRIWDLRQSRGPLVTIRTDAGINRLAISGTDETASDTALSSVLGTSVSGETGVSNHPPVTSSSTHHASLPGLSSTSALPGPAPNAQSNVLWATSYTRILALPLDNRGIKFYDLTGNRLGSITRSSSRAHARMVTSVAWADEGLCNFFSTGFDSRLLAWQIQLTSCG
ncbi:hypothetical protein P879_00271 [Paragonimus westermani]|uniref:WD repeat-containing protein 37 n=1 Tax=Paragonimus westermani TaxID=34504 RepID=A0A8T0DU24_9TREM|nr:hypothetical protein P879_00271 [Paragonimus westermani]